MSRTISEWCDVAYSKWPCEPVWMDTAELRDLCAAARVTFGYHGKLFGRNPIVLRDHFVLPKRPKAPVT